MPDRLREPARRPGVGQDLLGAHLRLHRLHHVAAADRGDPRAHRFARRTAAGRHGDRCRARLPRRGADVRRAARARLGQHGDDRGRGDLQRRARLQARRVEERPPDPRRARALARRPCSSASRSLPRSCRSSRTSRGARPSWPTSVGRSTGRGRSGHAAFALLQVATTLILVLAANTAYADFPRSGELRRGGRVPAATVHDARASPRVLQRDPGTVGGGDRPRDRLPGRHHQADPVLRDRRLHVLHAVAGRAWPSDTCGCARRGGASASLINGAGAVATAIVLVDHRAHEVRGGRLGDPGPRARCRVAPGPDAPAVRGRDLRARARPGDVHRRRTAGRRSRSCWWTIWTPRPCTPCSTRGRSVASARSRSTWRRSPNGRPRSCARGRSRGSARSRCGSCAEAATRRRASRASSRPTNARTVRSSCCCPSRIPGRLPSGYRIDAPAPV